MHKKGIANRDIKPSNALVTNSHYVNITDKNLLKKAIEEEPIICKITDFGEARSKLIQTRSILKTKTKCLQRGTPAFMPLEFSTGLLKSASNEDLIRGDMWSLGMFYYTLVNPNLASPFMIEVDNHPDIILDPEIFIRNLLEKKKNPEMSPKYAKQRAVCWSDLVYLYHLCTNYNALNRPTSSHVLQLLEQKEADVYGLEVSQSTALCSYDRQVSQGAVEPYPCNDGTNSCTFLCIKICFELQALTKQKQTLNVLCNLVEKVIKTYPIIINPHRNITSTYSTEEALLLMKCCDNVVQNAEVTKHLEMCGAFSVSGMMDLIKVLKEFTRMR